MIKSAFILFAVFIFTAAASLTGFAASPVTQQQMKSGKRVMEQDIDGVKAVFMVLNIREWLKGKPVPKSYKETHHLMVSFRDGKTGKPLNDGSVRVKLVAPDGREQTKDMIFMQWHFGEDFQLSQKGDYGVMVKFKLKDGKVRSTSFWYEVK